MTGDFAGTPLAIGSVYGVRQWDVDSFGRLTGLSYPQVWKPGENVATCNRRGQTEACLLGKCGKSHDDFGWASRYYNLPLTQALRAATFGGYCAEAKPCTGVDPNCGCGFWAYYNDATWSGTAIRGVVKGYGKTTIGTKGFRCEKAEIVALCLPTRKPLTWWNWLSLAVVAWCAVTCVLDVVESRWLFAAIQAALAAVNLGVVVWSYSTRTFPRIDKKLSAKVRAIYPGVAIFNDYDAMRKAFPLTKAEKPTPETDPEFWNRPANTVLPPKALRRGGASR